MLNATNPASGRRRHAWLAALSGLGLCFVACHPPRTAYAQAAQTTATESVAQQPAPTGARPDTDKPAASLAQVRDAERPAVARGDAPTWYGWQTILADVGSFGLMALGGGLDRPAVSLLGLSSYVIATPVIHMVHGNSWAGGSLGLRLTAAALLIGGAFVALSSALSGCHLLAEHSEPCGNAGGEVAGGIMFIAGLGLTVTMPFIDAARAVDRPARSSVAILPWLTPRADAGGLALVGRL